MSRKLFKTHNPKSLGCTIEIISLQSAHAGVLVVILLFAVVKRYFAN